MVVAAVAAAAVVAGCGSASGSAETGRQVAVFGDSLMMESSTPLEARAEGRYTPDIVAIAHTALCDDAPLVADALDRHRAPDLVVLQSAGDASSPCMGSGALAGDPAAVAQRASDDLAALLDQLAASSTPVLLLSSPPLPPVEGEAGRPAPTTEVFRRAAADPARAAQGVSFVDAGAAVAGPDGAWVAQLPCLPDEGADRGCRDGLVDVRAPDRLHLCPALAPGDQPGECPVYASGAERYAAAVDAAVQERLAALPD